MGPNEAGKSSILRSLHIACGVSPAQLPAAISSRDFSDKSKPVEISVVFGDLTVDEETAFTDQIVHGPNTLQIDVVATIDTIDDLVEVRRSFPDYGDARVTAQDITRIGWRFSAADRSQARDVSGRRSGALGRLLADVTIGNAAEFDAAAKALHDAIEHVSELTDLRLTLAPALEKALPRTVTDADLRFLSNSHLEDNPLRDVSLAMRDRGTWVALDEQSDGVQALAAHAISAVAHAKANVVAIDEPELHLHPPAQRALAAVLASSSTQHVIATNSPNVLSRFTPDLVLAIGADRVIRQLPAGAAALTARFIARWWAEPVIEPPTAARLVVVEGVLDRLIVRAVARELGIDLDRQNVALLGLDGANTIVNIRKLYGPDGFDVPTIGLVDHDKKDVWAKAFGVAAADLGTIGVQICTPALEAQLTSSLGAARVAELLVTGGFTQADVDDGCGSPADAARTVAFITGTRKTDAAVAISSALEATDAAALTPIRDLVYEAVA